MAQWCPSLGEYPSGLPLSPPADIFTQGWNPRLLSWQADSSLGSHGSLPPCSRGDGEGAPYRLAAEVRAGPVLRDTALAHALPTRQLEYSSGMPSTTSMMM